MAGPLFALPGVACVAGKRRAMKGIPPGTGAHGIGPGRRTLAAALGLLLLAGLPSMLRAQTDCLACHADKTHAGRSGTQRRRGCGHLPCQHSRQPELHRLPHHDQGVSPSRQVRRGEVRRLPRRSGNGNRRQRSCLRQRASLHQLPWRRPRHLPQDRCALRGLSAEHPAHLRHCHARRGAGKEVRPAECLFGVHGLHPWLCASAKRGCWWPQTA